MTDRLNFGEIWAKFIRNRAHRLRTSEVAAAQPSPSPSLIALQEKADRLGVTLRAAQASKEMVIYPTPDCLSGDELADFVNGDELPDERIKHLGECKPCCALLNMATPSEEILKVMLEQVRIVVGARAVSGSAPEAEMVQIFEGAKQEP